MKEVYSSLLRWKSARKYGHWSRNHIVSFPFEFVNIIHKKAISGLAAFLGYKSYSFQNMTAQSGTFIDSKVLSDDLCVDVKRYIKPLLTWNKSTAEIKMFLRLSQVLQRL